MIAHPLPPFSIKRYSTTTPVFQGTREIGCFSLTGPCPEPASDFKRLYHDDNSMLCHLERGNSKTTVRGLSLDLNEGYETFVRRPDPDDSAKNDHLEHLLGWIVLHSDVFAKVKPNVGIICNRGRLHELLVTPYEKMNGWVMCACRIDGIVYMTDFETTANEQARLARTDAKSLQSVYWGYKFEQYMTTHPLEEAALNSPVNSYEAYYSVLHAKVGKTGVLFAAEIDAEEKTETCSSPPGCYVELKTARKLSNEEDAKKFFDGKFRKWWAQSFICGVPRIIVGFPDDNDLIRCTDEIQTNCVVDAYHKKKIHWSPKICMQFLNEFLEFLHGAVVESYESAIYRFEWNPGCENVTSECLLRDDPRYGEHAFVPSWYLEHIASRI